MSHDFETDPASFRSGLSEDPPEDEWPKIDRPNLWKTAGIVAILVIAGVGYGWWAGWFTPPGSGFSLPSCPGSVQLDGAGSTFAAPAVDQWAEAFDSYSNCGQITYSDSGSTTGLANLSALSVDFAVTDAPLSSAQEAALPTASLTIPVTLGAVAVIYNLPGNPGGLMLNGSVLAGIYLGQITQWNTPVIATMNPEITLPTNLTIAPVHDTDWGGSSFAFTSYLAQTTPAWSATEGTGESVAWPAGIAVQGSLAMVAQVERTPGSIGYVGLPEALAAGETFAALENPSGAFVLPNATNVASAASGVASSLPAGNVSWANVSLVNTLGAQNYPIVTFSYVIIYEDLGKAYGSALSQSSAGWLVTFVYWMVDVAQNYSAALSYVPLPSAVVAVNIQTFELAKYNGTSLLGDPDHDKDVLHEKTGGLLDG
ncbi:MAG: phosphate ABC transporter substrate-binding protein PstS [Thermoplasmata archaeon]